MSLAPHEVRLLIEQLKALKHNVPEDSLVRKELYDIMRDLSFELEDPLDTVKRVSFSVLVIQLRSLLRDHCAE